MFRPFLCLLVGIAILGCQRVVPPEVQEAKPNDRPVLFDQQSGKNDLKVAVPISGSEPPDWGRLPFTITKITPNQKLTSQPPFHESGGDWQLLTCNLVGEPVVSFKVGVPNRDQGKKQFTWGKAAILVENRTVGERFVERFSRAFGRTSPPLRKNGLPLEPLRVNTAVLGSGLSENPGGGFGGNNGNWTATKWFLSLDGFEAEVYFNYNLVEKLGSFSEKDTDYRSDLFTIFSTALRDGQRPERTPETDANLTLNGPTIEPVTRLAGKGGAHAEFSRDSRFVIFTENGENDQQVIFKLALKDGERAPTEITRLEHHAWSVHVVNEDLDLLIEEGIPEQPPSRSSADPKRYWWVDGKRQTKTLLRGPEKDVFLQSPPTSPDGRFVAFQIWRDRREQKGKFSVIEFLDRSTGKTRVTEKVGMSLSVTGWEGTGPDLRATVEADRWASRDGKKPTMFLAAPLTGSIQEASHLPSPSSVPNPVSPDGSLRVAIRDGQLIVTQIATGAERRFQFHEDDGKFVDDGCVTWVSPRYLMFGGRRLSLIDTKTLKMSYPVPVAPSGQKQFGHQFSQDFRWVLYRVEHENGTDLYLGRILNADSN